VLLGIYGLAQTVQLGLQRILLRVQIIKNGYYIIVCA
jgi:hypothetical protein